MKAYESQAHFTRDERQGLYFIIVCISLLILGIFIFNSFSINGPVIYEPYKQDIIASFAANIAAEDNGQNRTSPKPPKTSINFIFDPNTTPLDSLTLLPMSKKVASTIVKYRSKGGKFRKPEDLKKIYGMESYYDQLEPMIRIRSQNVSSLPKVKSREKSHSLDYGNRKDFERQKRSTVTTMDSSAFVQKIKEEDKNVQSNSLTHSFSKDSTHIYKEKEEESSIILGLNTANEYELQLINGIGPYYAEKIVKYRNKIGGFYTTDQLAEVIKRDEALQKVLPHLTCDPSMIKKRNINMIQADSLAYVPGISYKKAKIAMRYIENHYPLTGQEDLERIRIFSKEEIDLMMVYLTFE